MNYFSSDSLVEISDYAITSRTEPIDVSQFNSNKVIFCNTHRLIELFSILKDNPNRFVLITHLSDYNIEQVYINRKPKCIVSWFGQNIVGKSIDETIITPVPIGVFTKERDGLNRNQILTFSNNYRQYNVYFNTDPNTNLGERERAWEYSKKIGNSLVYLNNRFTADVFVNNLKQCKYVVSPPGYGIDCFRTWEGLHVGTIPIVRRSVSTEYFSKLFPMILIDVWEDLSLSYLESNFPKEKYNLDYLQYLDSSYWQNLILKSKNSLLY